MNQEQQYKKQKQEQEQEVISKLRQEAYADLHATLQHYNDEFITQMRYMEKNHTFSASTDSLSSSNTIATADDDDDDDEIIMQNLVELFEAGTVKDYSQLIEYESYKVSVRVTYMYMHIFYSFHDVESTTLL
jgi:hypothetical protein